MWIDIELDPLYRCCKEDLDSELDECLKNSTIKWFMVEMPKMPVEIYNFLVISVQSVDERGGF